MKTHIFPTNTAQVEKSIGHPLIDVRRYVLRSTGHTTDSNTSMVEALMVAAKQGTYMEVGK